jgi:hypothetical protein
MIRWIKAWHRSNTQTVSVKRMTTLQDHIDIEKWDIVYELVTKDNSLIKDIDPYDLAWKVVQYALVEKGEEKYFYDYCSFDDLKKTIKKCKELGLVARTIPQAVAFQDIDTIKFLLEDGHNVDEQDFGERTGLIVGSLLNDLTLTQFLIDNNAWVNFFDQDSLEAIDYTTNETIFNLLKSLGGQTKSERNEAMNDYYDAVEVMNDMRSTQMEFMEGAENGEILKMENALKRPKGFWVLNGSWPVNGKTALHLATEKNRVEATKFLIEKGLDINKPDLNGETPFDIAKRLNLTEILTIMTSKND